MKLSVQTYMSPVLLSLPSSVKADRELKTFANSELARICEPYTPMQTGTMSQSARITSEDVTYPGPYAHYQYTGMVYGPNIPIRENGNIIGWWSRPGVPKSPTGRHLHYSQQGHPLAQDHWDQAAMAVHKQDLTDAITLFVVDRILSGG